MYFKTCSGHISENNFSATKKGLLDAFIPETTKSASWKHWQAVIDPKTCPKCLELHGKIYAVDEMPPELPPLHENCRCAILRMGAIIPGGATKDGEDGADYWLANYGRLPDYYITDSELRELGWSPGKKIVKYAPGKMFYKGIYFNDNGHLPSAPGRTWYEADINYYDGHRNQHRILFSSDGLIFVTYDHYLTFYEVKLED